MSFSFDTCGRSARTDAAARAFSAVAQLFHSMNTCKRATKPF
jgi:hypothetical protein